MTFDEAQKAIEDQFKPAVLGEEDAVLLEAYNRVLNEDVVSTLDIPPFNRSTVDGYTVKAEDTFGAEENQPVTLKVSGVVNVGEQPKVVLAKGEAVEIVTGAPIPDGADAVVTQAKSSAPAQAQTVQNQDIQPAPQVNQAS